MENLKKLFEELDKPWPKSKEKLIATKDENGVVHITTESGTPRMMMPKSVYNELLKYKPA
jgi:hypothetical protein